MTFEEALARLRRAEARAKEMQQELDAEQNSRSDHERTSKQ